jgi:hypothetical protein
MNEWGYILEMEIELNNDDDYNTIYRYYDTYEEALNGFNILVKFATYATVFIRISDEFNVLKEVQLTNGEDE